MSIFIPPQQKTTTHYVRWTTISAFVVCMLWLISFFYDEYRTAEYAKLSAVKMIEEVNVKNAQIEEHNTKAEAHNSKTEKKIVKKKIVTVDKSEPTGGSAPQLPKSTPEEAVASVPDDHSVPKPAPVIIPKIKEPKVVEIEEVVEVKPTPIQKESKIEIDAGIVKVAMSNESSWMAIFKIVFTILFTFFGIRLINFGFSKLQSQPKLVDNFVE